MIKKIDHIVFTTSNVDSCINFYVALGFTLRNEGNYELYAGDFKINVHIRNHELHPHALYIQSGSADLCFEIDDDIERYKQTLENKGFTIEQGIVKRSGVKGSMQSIYLRDPDGNLIEFCSYN